ncbi:MAG TPA: phosphoadenosine phosphosulfate reductase family protein [Ktedonobacterales bacterium]|nr:phosphoadenosine phosphosulfate reductase family protein [Ktedonobacterales bacterium]
MTISVRHILSLSGGKDSAALAVYMRDRVPQMEYLFHDTGKELPETYDYLSRLEALLGKKITRSTSNQNFDTWLAIYGGMIPSNHRRWCTRMLKLKPFEDYVSNDPVYNYIGIRADEDRVGYISHKPNITPVYPFRDDGIIRADVIRILEESGLGLPPYMDWGRTRSGCFFCFYQQKIEWVRLKQTHPDLFEEAKRYEHANAVTGEAFHWNGRESLDELERPERMEEIVRNWESSRARRVAPNRPLLQILSGEEEEEEEREGCLICSL